MFMCNPLSYDRPTPCSLCTSMYMFHIKIKGAGLSRFILVPVHLGQGVIGMRSRPPS